MNTVETTRALLRDVKTAMAASTDPAAMADVHSIQLELYAPYDIELARPTICPQMTRA